MIILTRLGGHQFAVNPDLIERAEVTPDTVITLTDGHKLVVAEPLTEVVALVRTWRAQITSEAYRLLGAHPGQDHAAADTDADFGNDEIDDADGAPAPSATAQASLGSLAALRETTGVLLRLPRREG
jgi:flagellar protein FlbD